MRIWLQSTSLLAVVAGYSLLLLIGSAFRQVDRERDHQQLVDAISEQLRVRPGPAPIEQALGVEVTLLPAGQPQLPQLTNGRAGQQWMVSRRWLSISGRSRLLEVRQNVTSRIKQDRIDQLLLVAAAGASMLFTSFLLRLVLRRGLVLPLGDLKNQLNSLEADRLGERLLNPSHQPEELRQIADAFNGLQTRLGEAWSRERTFVDGVAHELRTPISVISAQAQRLDLASLPHPSAASAGLIASEAHRMGELVRVLLDFARSDSGRLQLEMQWIDPEQVLVEAFERLQALAPERLQLAAASANAMPLICADAARMHQSLAVLIDNALKYSSAAVLLAADLDAANGDVVLHVLDRGPGIPAADRSVVVQRFQRGRSAIGTRGSGIGLATVTLLMEAMTAELRIADRPGGGADLQLRFKASGLPPAP